MSRSFFRKQMPSIAVGLLDVFVIGLGMGVPFFAILLGFGVGWWYARRATAAPEADAMPRSTRDVVRALVGAAGALAAVTFVVALLVWAGAIPNAFDPSFDAAGWGIPLILYTSQPSMIGWLALMIVISPALQFMAVVTGGALALAVRRPEAAGSSQ